MRQMALHTDMHCTPPQSRARPSQVPAFPCVCARVQLKHPIDGDGMVCALTFVGGKVHFRSRFVRSRHRMEEAAARQLLYKGQMGTCVTVLTDSYFARGRGLGGVAHTCASPLVCCCHCSEPRGAIAQTLSAVKSLLLRQERPRLKFRNPSNTNVFYWGGKVRHVRWRDDVRVHRQIAAHALWSAGANVLRDRPSPQPEPDHPRNHRAGHAQRCALGCCVLWFVTRCNPVVHTRRPSADRRWRSRRSLHTSATTAHRTNWPL